jgi:hypothetical protein
MKIDRYSSIDVEMGCCGRARAKEEKSHYKSGQPFARNHFSISRCPPCAAYAHVLESHGAPFARNHCSTSRRPPCAAYMHVFAFHPKPFASPHCSNSRCPPNAARRNVVASRGQPFACNHCSISRSPRLAAYAHVFAFHGQPFAAPTAAPRGAHPLPPPSTSTRSMGSRSRASTAAY